MDDKPDNNKRRFPRFPLAQPVAYGEADAYPEEGAFGHDLSLGGVCLEVNRLIPVGKVLTINLRLKNGKVVTAIARVMWVSEVSMADRFKIGLNFEQFVQGNAEQINEYLFR